MCMTSALQHMLSRISKVKIMNVADVDSAPDEGGSSLRMIHSMNTCKAHHCNHYFQGMPLSRVGTLISTRMGLILALILKTTRGKDEARPRLIGNRLVFVDLVSREMLKLTR